MTCASALDAYADFHIEVTLRSAGVKKPNIDALLRLTSKQAERRMGAFLAVEAAIRNKQPEWIDKGMIELRN